MTFNRTAKMFKEVIVRIEQIMGNDNKIVDHFLPDSVKLLDKTGHIDKKYLPTTSVTTESTNPWPAGMIEVTSFLQDGTIITKGTDSNGVLWSKSLYEPTEDVIVSSISNGTETWTQAITIESSVINGQNIETMTRSLWIKT